MLFRSFYVFHNAKKVITAKVWQNSVFSCALVKMCIRDSNVGFAYLTVACIDTTALATHLPQFFITFIVGSILFNGVCVLLMKPAKALAVKSVQKENA